MVPVNDGYNGVYNYVGHGVMCWHVPMACVSCWVPRCDLLHVLIPGGTQVQSLCLHVLVFLCERWVQLCVVLACTSCLGQALGAKLGGQFICCSCMC